MSIVVSGSDEALRLSHRRRSRQRAALVLGLMVVLGGAARLSGQTVTLQAIADTTIKQDSPNHNFGAQKTLPLKEGGNRVLVRFDPAAITAAVGGGSLASAQLQLYIGTNAANWGPTGRTVDAYRVDAAWVERAATWNCANDTNLVNSAPDCAGQWNGGTIAGDATDTVVLTNARAGWIQFDVTADVQAFLGGTEDDGWLIQKTDEGQAGRVDLVSREGTAGQGPRLVLLSESATVDTVPPSLAIVSPAQPLVVNVASPPIAVAYHDGGSGVDTSTLQILLDGQTLTAACTVGAQSATCTPPPLAAGTHTVVANLRDHAGNAASATKSFQLLIGPSVNTLTLPVTADTYITRRAPDREHGRAAFLRVAKGGPSRTLVQFDPAPLTAALAGNHLLSAQLELSIAANGNNWGASGRTVGAYRLTTAWSEGSATWDCPADSNLDNARPDCATPWNGGAFASSPTATALLTRHLAGTVAFDVTSDVAAFLAGTTDAGWLLAKTDETSSGRVDFVSREATSGQAAQLVVVFQVPSGDTTPPTVVITSPADGSLLAIASPTITATYVDPDSPADPASVRLVLDGVDSTAAAQVSASGLTLTPAALADGAHRVTVSARDSAGNLGQATARFTIDTTPPTVAITSPSPVVSDTVTPTVAVSLSDATSGVDPATLHVFLGETELTRQCVVAAGTVTCSTSPLTAGGYVVTARVNDRAGNLGAATAFFQLQIDQQPPALAITSPSDPLVIGNATPTLTVTYSDPSGVDLTTLRISLDGVVLTAGCTVGPATASCTAPPLARGAHTIAAQISDTHGNLATAQSDFVVSLPLAIAFTTPAPETVVAAPVVGVAGTVTPTAQSVLVNGVPATLSGGTFTITSLGLHDGINNLVAVAQDAAGNVGTAAVRVVADTTPPALSVTSPASGTATSAAAINVSGLVNDLRVGTVGEAEVTVTVNGAAADVANRSFLARGVALAPGLNTLTVVATDRAGNQTTATVKVIRQSLAGIKLQAVSGDLQTAPISSPLPAPLVVQAADASGLPLPNAQVLFQVVQGDGLLAGGGRSQIVISDPQGRASASWTLGDRAGVGVDRVRATAVGAQGGGLGVVFSAITTTGATATTYVVLGNQQRGAVGTELAQPLEVVVTDRGGNPVAGVPVTFTAVAGGGSFGGAANTVAPTDASGIALARFTLGPAEGLDNNVVTATFTGLARVPATFQASALVPGDPAATQLVGVVLDNQGAAVPGVTLRLRNSLQTALTDAQGQFSMAGVPVGQVFLIADATTTSLPGSWASLEFELFTVAGAVNTLPRPIYILPIDLSHGLAVDETHGGTLTIPSVPGFALEIAAGSVTFPGGGRNGVISVTAVHPDRVPMAPGAGMQPHFIVTIQPAGARFTPPARITFPNVDALHPGKVTELFSFDHDIGAFVSIGTGTVSEDGLVVAADPGFGVVQAGWHCGSPAGGQGQGASLSVSLSPNPIKIQYGQTAKVTAAGRPPLDGQYTGWQVTNSKVDNMLAFAGQPSCDDQPSCANTLQSSGATSFGPPPPKVCGTAQARVTFLCKVTGKTVTGTANIEQGCGGKSAAECASYCSQVPPQGMCGTPCKLIGAHNPPFDPGSGTCWRVQEGGTWYCYWDVRVPNGPGFKNLCCPNRCHGASNNPWEQGEGQYLCTVIEACASNPAFGGPDPQGDPGQACAKINPGDP